MRGVLRFKSRGLAPRQAHTQPKTMAKARRIRVSDKLMSPEVGDRKSLGKPSVVGLANQKPSVNQGVCRRARVVWGGLGLRPDIVVIGMFTLKMWADTVAVSARETNQ